MSGGTLGAALADGAERLAAAGVDNPRRDARFLLALAVGRDEAAIVGYPDAPLGPAPGARFDALLARRVRREPCSRIAGRREFWSQSFGLTPDTLDPRPDSETLIEAALERFDDRAAPLRIVDLGTGSGCLLLALLGELPRAVGLGVNILPGAAAAARRNAAALGLTSRAFFAVGDWAAALAGPVDAVLCNPPYVATAALAGLMPEVARWEPRPALDGGSDGLAAYRALAPGLAHLIRPGGFACLELGAGQAPEVAALCAREGLETLALKRDLQGMERCLTVAPGRPGQAKKSFGIYALPV